MKCGAWIIKIKIITRVPIIFLFFTILSCLGDESDNADSKISKEVDMLPFFNSDVPSLTGCQNFIPNMKPYYRYFFRPSKETITTKKRVPRTAQIPFDYVPSTRTYKSDDKQGHLISEMFSSFYANNSFKHRFNLKKTGPPIITTGSPEPEDKQKQKDVFVDWKTPSYKNSEKELYNTFNYKPLSSIPAFYNFPNKLVSTVKQQMAIPSQNKINLFSSQSDSLQLRHQLNSNFHSGVAPLQRYVPAIQNVSLNATPTGFVAIFSNSQNEDFQRMIRVQMLQNQFGKLLFFPNSIIPDKITIPIAKKVDDVQQYFRNIWNNPSNPVTANLPVTYPKSFLSRFQRSTENENTVKQQINQEYLQQSSSNSFLSDIENSNFENKDKGQLKTRKTRQVFPQFNDFQQTSGSPLFYNIPTKYPQSISIRFPNQKMRQNQVAQDLPVNINIRQIFPHFNGFQQLSNNPLFSNLPMNYPQSILDRFPELQTRQKQFVQQNVFGRLTSIGNQFLQNIPIAQNLPTAYPSANPLPQNPLAIPQHILNRFRNFQKRQTDMAQQFQENLFKRIRTIDSNRLETNPNARNLPAQYPQSVLNRFPALQSLQNQFIEDNVFNRLSNIDNARLRNSSFSDNLPMQYPRSLSNTVMNIFQGTFRDDLPNRYPVRNLSRFSQPNQNFNSVYVNRRYDNAYRINGGSQFENAGQNYKPQLKNQRRNLKDVQNKSDFMRKLMLKNDDIQNILNENEKRQSNPYSSTIITNILKPLPSNIKPITEENQEE